MAPVDKTDPLKFVVETYDKTAHLRMRWNVNHEAQLKETAAFRGVQKGYTEQKVARTMIEGMMAATSRDFILSGLNRMHVPPLDDKYVQGVAVMKKGHSISDVGLGDPENDPRLARPDTDASPDPIMRPVPPTQKRIIYDGQDDGLPFGRLEYLKVRNRMKPEDKYYFQESMGWAYGWRLKDSYFGKQAPPQYGWINKVSKGNRSGPQPDPEDICDLL